MTMYQNMRLVKTIFVLIVATFRPQLGICSDDELTESKNEEFIPTHEWQQVKAGQSIPPGLHIRMDLANGGKWAKLISKDNIQEETQPVLVKEEVEGVKKSVVVGENGQYKLEELKSALKKMKEEKFAGTEEYFEETEEYKKKIKEKFRSMDDIKSAFEELNLKQESDYEAMVRLLNVYNDSAATVEEKVFALQDIEYYVHQVDNANDFVKMDGLLTIIQALNGTSPQIQEEAAHIIGSAVQSNPSVQVKTIELGGLPALLRLLGDKKQQTGVRKKVIYALSSLIRNFPAAQYFFSKAGGFSILMGLIKEHHEAEKLKLKAVSLINDLVVERLDLRHLENAGGNEEKIRQYKLFSLSSAIQEMGMCQDMAEMLKSESHDWRETLLTAMKNLHNVCQRENQYSLKVVDALQDFQAEYKDLSDTEEHDGDYDSFFHHMHDAVTELLKLFGNENQASARIEL